MRWYLFKDAARSSVERSGKSATQPQQGAPRASKFLAPQRSRQQKPELHRSSQYHLRLNEKAAPLNRRVGKRERAPHKEEQLRTECANQRRTNERALPCRFVGARRARS